MPSTPMPRFLPEATTWCLCHDPCMSWEDVAVEAQLSLSCLCSGEGLQRGPQSFGGMGGPSGPGFLPLAPPGPCRPP